MADVTSCEKPFRPSALLFFFLGGGGGGLGFVFTVNF